MQNECIQKASFISCTKKKRKKWSNNNIERNPSRYNCTQILFMSKFIVQKANFSKINSLAIVFEILICVRKYCNNKIKQSNNDQYNEKYNENVSENLSLSILVIKYSKINISQSICNQITTCIHKTIKLTYLFES